MRDLFRCANVSSPDSVGVVNPSLHGRNPLTFLLHGERGMAWTLTLTVMKTTRTAEYVDPSFGIHGLHRMECCLMLPISRDMVRRATSSGTLRRANTISTGKMCGPSRDSSCYIVIDKVHFYGWTAYASSVPILCEMMAECRNRCRMSANVHPGPSRWTVCCHTCDIPWQRESRARKALIRGQLYGMEVDFRVGQNTCANTEGDKGR